MSSQECGICLDNLSTKQIGSIHKVCPHLFCYSCIRRWCEISSTCPFCKREILQLRNETTLEIQSIQQIRPVPAVELDHDNAPMPQHVEFLHTRTVNGRSLRGRRERGTSSALQKYREDRARRQIAVGTQLARLRRNIQRERKEEEERSSSSSSSTTSTTSTTSPTFSSSSSSSSSSYSTTIPLDVHIERNKQALRRAAPTSELFQALSTNKRLIQELLLLEKEEQEEQQKELERQVQKTMRHGKRKKRKQQNAKRKKRRGK